MLVKKKIDVGIAIASVIAGGLFIWNQIQLRKNLAEQAKILKIQNKEHAKE